MTEITTLQIFYFFAILGFILVVARFLGFVGERLFGLPTVLGEIITGIIIGPFALGYYIFPTDGIFTPLTTQTPVPTTLYMFGQVGVVILLFYIGLESDINKFIKGSFYGIITAISEGTMSFLLVTLFVYWYSKDLLPSLFMGAILASTSIGITVRVLKDLKKLDSREGMGILVIGVFDDIIGIIFFITVMNIASNKFNLQSIILTIIEVIIFILIFIIIGTKLSGWISRILGLFKHRETRFAMVITILFLLTVLTIQLGLTMVLGSLIFGLALSKIKQKNEILHDLSGLYEFFVPIFFVTVGMMMNLANIITSLVVTLIIFVAAYLGKVVGASIPSMYFGFSVKESFRIGNALLPRAEVPLVVSSIALVQGFISEQFYNVSILMVLLTIILGPILYIRLSKGAENERNNTEKEIHSENNR